MADEAEVAVESALGTGAGLTTADITGLVKLRGLPFEANALMICDFFESHIEEWQIHFVQDMKSSKPHCGECIIDCV